MTRIVHLLGCLALLILVSCTVSEPIENESDIEHLLELQRNNTQSQELILQTTKRSYGPDENVTLIVASTGVEYHREARGTGNPYTVNRIFPNGTIQTYPRVCRAFAVISTESFDREPTSYTWSRSMSPPQRPCGYMDAPPGTYFFSISPDYVFVEGSRQFVNVSVISNTFELISEVESPTTVGREGVVPVETHEDDPERVSEEISEIESSTFTGYAGVMPIEIHEDDLERLPEEISRSVRVRQVSPQGIALVGIPTQMTEDYNLSSYGFTDIPLERKTSASLEHLMQEDRSFDEQVYVTVMFLELPDEDGIDRLLADHQATVVGTIESIDAITLELPFQKLPDLLSLPEVVWIDSEHETIGLI